jgi:hypothetical protein
MARLMIAKPDRLFRNLVFVSALMDSGIEFGAVDNPHYPHTNRLTLHIARRQDRAAQAGQACGHE